eukprot:1811238-Rhodomonas_salina.3
MEKGSSAIEKGCSIWARGTPYEINHGFRARIVLEEKLPKSTAIPVQRVLGNVRLVFDFARLGLSQVASRGREGGRLPLFSLLWAWGP